jgi:hypothetical protein
MKRDEEREHEIFKEGSFSCFDCQVAPHSWPTMSSEHELMNSNDISSSIEAFLTEVMSFITYARLS